VIDVALEAWRRAEMEEDAHFELGCSQVAEQLHPIGWQESFSRFVFDDYFVVDHHVESLARDVPPLVPDINQHLPNDNVAAVVKFTRERPTINASLKPYPK
jgi:hypothetical protein